jgi:Cu2+-exporting ATPase
LTDEYDENKILQLAAAAQQNSEHHIANGILRKLKEKNLELLRSENFNYIKGIGVSAIVNGKEITAVGPNLFQAK